ncbi:uncharacterized protein G2W53_029321 [Senna tora]|uniref:Uncharacterized protein n=1 Tax=Senna tora TaxID=362788 RepID=A0A834T512_9FABA|nr:uncharacterized protein G2W53_029321 [Senna tora]
MMLLPWVKGKLYLRLLLALILPSWIGSIREKVKPMLPPSLLSTCHVFAESPQLEIEAKSLRVDRKRDILTNNALALLEYFFYNGIRKLQLENPSLQLGRANYGKEVFGDDIREGDLTDGQLAVRRGLVRFRPRSKRRFGTRLRKRSRPRLPRW